MCGFVVSVSAAGRPAENPGKALRVLRHRGPDDQGTWSDPSGTCWMGHCRLSIIDLSSSGRQPMASPDGRYQLVFNGEIYNYLELKAQLSPDFAFSTATDSEVLLAAYIRWGEACLDRLVGMFSFAVWDQVLQTLFVVRDRFGVKPLYYHVDRAHGMLLASEIKALHAMGVSRGPDEGAWSVYLRHGLYDHGRHTFWRDIQQLPPGHVLQWSPQSGASVSRWYDVADRALRAGPDERNDAEVEEELRALLLESVALRFRSDVPVGVCLSGGLDSSLLLGLIRHVFGDGQELQSFTFHCNDSRYDETPWVRTMLEGTRIRPNLCLLTPRDIPDLALAVQVGQDEPFGGFPTLGMALVHARAKDAGVTVLLDGNGMDEGWAGYEYYGRAQRMNVSEGPVQGSLSRAVRPDCLQEPFAHRAEAGLPGLPFPDALRNLQYRDMRFTKIPRAMRFADRVSMMYSRELREPFLDHRILELGLRQPPSRTVGDGRGKWLPRRIAADLLPQGLAEAPKRPVQTPQREWLRGPLSAWAEKCIEAGLRGWGRDWLDCAAVRRAWHEYADQGADNSFPVWQWVSLGLMQDAD